MPRFLARLRPIALVPLAVACGGALLLASCTGNIGQNTPGGSGSSVGGGSAGAGAQRRRRGGKLLRQRWRRPLCRGSCSRALRA